MQESQDKVEIEIDATPSTVWSVLVAVDKYPLWNPYVRRIDIVCDCCALCPLRTTSLSPGTRMVFHLDWGFLHPLLPSTTHEVVRRVQAPTLLEWQFAECPSPCLGTSRNVQTLESLDGGRRTRYTTTMHKTGIFPCISPTDLIHQRVQLTALALKRHSEQMQAQAQ